MRFCVVVAIALASIVAPATPSLAVDYRLEIVTGGSDMVNISPALPDLQN